SSVTVTTTAREWPSMNLGLLGAHQAANASVVVACVEELRSHGLDISDSAAANGFAAVVWPARLEVLQPAPWVILDCAHNTAAVKALVETLDESFPPCRRILVFGASSDKDIGEMLRLLAPHFQQAFFTQFAGSLRAVPAEELAQIWHEITDRPCRAFA